MSAAPRPERLERPHRDPPPPIWHCDQNTILCRYGHERIRVRDESMNLGMRVDGHVWFECPKCAPHSFAFGIAAVRPTVMVTFYACSKPQYEHIRGMPDDVDTFDVLRYLGYIPPRP